MLNSNIDLVTAGGGGGGGMTCAGETDFPGGGGGGGLSGLSASRAQGGTQQLGGNATITTCGYGKVGTRYQGGTTSQGGYGGGGGGGWFGGGSGVAKFCDVGGGGGGSGYIGGCMSGAATAFTAAGSSGSSQGQAISYNTLGVDYGDAKDYLSGDVMGGYSLLNVLDKNSGFEDDANAVDAPSFVYKTPLGWTTSGNTVVIGYKSADWGHTSKLSGAGRVFCGLQHNGASISQYVYVNHPSNAQLQISFAASYRLNSTYQQAGTKQGFLTVSFNGQNVFHQELTYSWQVYTLPPVYVQTGSYMLSLSLNETGSCPKSGDCTIYLDQVMVDTLSGAFAAGGMPGASTPTTSYGAGGNGLVLLTPIPAAAQAGFVYTGQIQTFTVGPQTQMILVKVKLKIRLPNKNVLPHRHFEILTSTQITHVMT